MTLPNPGPSKSVAKLRDWFSRNLGVTQSRKLVIYSDLIQAVTLRDFSYWLQVLFSAGIATLGLVLNSPAVIIGAMLISPLMSGILASGLALAVGDLVLGVRSLSLMALSCAMAIGFAIVLVGVLPFKEMTPEILARTRPNVLDLVIALFSGALGAIAIAKEVRGMPTSIPGVAIAVALMPPLCVVGHGIGVAISLNWEEGMNAAKGGGLLFLTNLAAIILMAMIVFVTLHMDPPQVRDQVRQQHGDDPESHAIQSFLEQLPASRRLKAIGSLPSRFIVILVPILALLIPLTRSLSQLTLEIGQRQQTNRIEQLGKTLWKEKYAQFDDGEPRSYINQFLLQNDLDKLTFQLSVFTSKLYTDAEKQAYIQAVADRLNRSPDSISLQLVQIPTASNKRIAELVRGEVVPDLLPIDKLPPPAPPNIPNIQAALLEATEAALHSFALPKPASLVNYALSTSPSQASRLDIAYLSPREISTDATTLLVNDLHDRLEANTIEIHLNWIPTNPNALAFDLDQATLLAASNQRLDQIGRYLSTYPTLRLKITLNRETLEPDTIGQARSQAIRSYLAREWNIASDRVITATGDRLPEGTIPTVALTLSQVSAP